MTTKDQDPLFNEAVKIIKNTGIVSICYFQHELNLGYARAARLINQLEEAKMIGPVNKKLIAKNKKKVLLNEKKIDLLYPKILVWLRDKEVITQEDVQEKFRVDQVVSERILDLLENDGLLEPQFRQSKKHKIL